MKPEEMKLLVGVKTLAITCRQFGDTGKGKFADIFSQWADIIARGTGGDNAGHTICFERQKLITHLVPSGILYDSQGKINVVGSGAVINPASFLQETTQLAEKGCSYKNLKIAYNAKLILPTEVVLDRAKEAMAGAGKIGSTGKGIGPAYTDFVGREGLMIGDLLNPDFFAEKLERHLRYKKAILKNYDPELLEGIMCNYDLSNGLYYDPEDIFNFDAIFRTYMVYGEKLRPFITDTDSFMRENLGKKNILLEGAQGDLLSIDRGTYPFVTSSDCTVAGLAKGVGLKETDIDLSLGIIKGFYMTRVGAGPFPTELGGEESDKRCNGGKENRAKEKDFYGDADVNSEHEFIQGVALRMAGDEYGATTGRPRRTGWIDLPLLRYTLGFNSPDLILTKLDVLNDCKTIKVCNHYKYTGPDCVYANQKIKTGSYPEIASPAAEILKHCKPIYVSFPGWKCSLKDCHDYDSLPEELKNILAFIIKNTGAKPRIISTGPDREETIFLDLF